MLKRRYPLVQMTNISYALQLQVMVSIFFSIGTTLLKSSGKKVVPSSQSITNMTNMEVSDDFVAIGNEFSVKLYSMLDGSCIQRIPVSGNVIAFNQDGNVLACGDNSVFIYRIKDNRFVFHTQIQGIRKAKMSVAFHPTLNYVAIAENNYFGDIQNAVSIWDYNEKTHIKTFTDFGGYRMVHSWIYSR